MPYKLLFFILIILIPSTKASEEAVNKHGQYEFDSILLSDLKDSTGKIIKTVTASGYGVSIDAAAQNAAENALTQVVGSFIDSETLIKKQNEIRDGVISKTKLIRKEIKDYSQGSIKYFEILNIDQNGSVFNVTARVDVRVDDFKAYIKKLAFGSTSVSKEVTRNLFTKAVISADNLKNKYDIFFKNVINPIRKAEVYEIEIGNITALEDFQKNSNLCMRFPKYSPCRQNGQFRSWDINRTFVFPFTISLESNFKENMINTLENISDKRIDTYNFNSFEDFYDASNVYINSTDLKRDYAITIYSINNKSKSTFILKDVLYYWKTKNKIKDNELGEKYFSNPSLGTDKDSCYAYKNWFNPLLLKFKGENNQTLANYEYSTYGCFSSNNYPISILDPYAIKATSWGFYHPKYSLFASGKYSRHEKAIFQRRQYFIVAELDLEILKNLRNIEIEFFQKNK